MNIKNKKIVISTLILITILLSIMIFVSYSYYDSQNTIDNILSEIQNGNLEEDTLAMYVDGNAISSMNAVPSGYVIDEENSYCYTTNSNNHDGNATLYTNNNGEHVIGNLVTGEKCVVYFVEGMKLINFTVYLHDGAKVNESFTFTAEQGMTFRDWIHSEYNNNPNVVIYTPGNICVYFEYNCFAFTSCNANDSFEQNSLIVENTTYEPLVDGPAPCM